MGVIVTNEFRNGARLELDGEPYIIVEFQHVKPGKGGAFVRTRLKSLKAGSVSAILSSTKSGSSTVMAFPR